MAYENLLVERHDGVMVVTINRPKVLNALNAQTLTELGQVLDEVERDDTVRVIVLTGAGDRSFVAGADINELAVQSPVGGREHARRGQAIFDRLEHLGKPVIAAVAGFALGGGCELAMMCDFIIAADTAKFGQPEIKLGIIPGAGGTQRLPRAVGKAKAMDLILTGRMMDAAEAERGGLVARVVPAAELMTEVLAAADIINELGTTSVLAAKESVNRAFESSLADGVMFERRLFHMTFATDDQKEGMDAFLAKRKATFRR